MSTTRSVLSKRTRLVLVSLIFEVAARQFWRHDSIDEFTLGAEIKMAQPLLKGDCGSSGVEPPSSIQLRNKILR